MPAKSVGLMRKRFGVYRYICVHSNGVEIELNKDAQADLQETEMN